MRNARHSQRLPLISSLCYDRRTKHTCELLFAQGSRLPVARARRAFVECLACVVRDDLRERNDRPCVRLREGGVRTVCECTELDEVRGEDTKVAVEFFTVV